MAARCAGCRLWQQPEHYLKIFVDSKKLRKESMIATDLLGSLTNLIKRILFQKAVIIVQTRIML